MKVILLREGHLGSKTLIVNKAILACASLGGVWLMAAMIYLGYWLSSDSSDMQEMQTLAGMHDGLQEQKDQLGRLRQQTEDQLDAYAVRVAQLQARILRIEALGDRLSDVASLDKGEFDFSRQPALGGPEEELPEAEVYQAPQILDDLARLEHLINDREQQLGILQTLMANRQLEDDGYLAGRPITKGWMSSPYGRRADPFHGKPAWHKGVDFAGKEDSSIVAVASGVVTWSGERYGYGRLVEINHGNGYATRYAHNKENMAEVGDVVKKGQVIAKMGSSGRSTGPHVHFEVLQNGKGVNPSRYINRAHR